MWVFFISNIPPFLREFSYFLFLFFFIPNQLTLNKSFFDLSTISPLNDSISKVINIHMYLYIIMVMINFQDSSLSFSVYTLRTAVGSFIVCHIRQAFEKPFKMISTNFFNIYFRDGKC